MKSSLEEAINFFAKLPGLGPRSARRLLLYLLKNKDQKLSKSIIFLSKINDELLVCSSCNNLDTEDPCGICKDPKRTSSKICVVEEIADLWAIEKTREFKGYYHVLGGCLSAVDGIGPEELEIDKLIQRVTNDNVEEIILATNATSEGQLTAQYIADCLSGSKILISRLAHGMPIGSELDYIDEGTLSTALKLRSEFR